MFSPSLRKEGVGGWFFLELPNDPMSGTFLYPNPITQIAMGRTIDNVPYFQ